MRAFGFDGKPIVDAWDIVQYYYCPRKLYFLKTLGVPYSLRKKMEKGAEDHVKEIKRLAERKSVFDLQRNEVKAIHHRLRLESKGLGLVGQVDIVLETEEGAVIPVEVKCSEYTEAFIGRKKQLTAYALLLEEAFGRMVNRAIIYYPA